jgi:two-component system sensor histidine kinase CreC
VAVALHAEPDVTLHGDRLLLASAVISLLENAIEFSPPGSGVEISIGSTRHEALLAVRDHGPGIPEYALGRVFERFYSLSRPDGGKRGTGLGLVFVKEIAELHGGSAQLDNASGGGAIATLRLPLGKGA